MSTHQRPKRSVAGCRLNLGMLIEFVSVPGECYCAADSTTDVGIETQFVQELVGGGTKSKTGTVHSDTPFLLLYGLRPYVDLDFSVKFDAKAPGGCVKNLEMISNPSASAGFPVSIPNGGLTRFDTDAPWSGVGYPTNGGTPVTFDDLASGKHPCHSTLQITTSLK